MRRDYFLLGLGSRILMLAIFLFGNYYDEYNDMSEIIYYALDNFLKGLNPYSMDYVIEWGANSFSQPFNYGPVTLFLMLPAMLLPFWYNSCWIGMYVVINVYIYLLCEFMIKIASKDLGLQKNAKISHSDLDPRENRIIYYCGLFFWMIPIGTTIVTIFIYAPIFLTVLGFNYRKNALLSALCLSMAAMSYQLAYLFLPIYVIYNYKKNWKSAGKFILGCLPAFGLLMIFELWRNGGAIRSLFLYTSNMGYNKCPNCAHSFDSWSIFSIPKIIYNVSDGAIQIGNQARLVMFMILGGICIYYFFSKKFDAFPEKFFNQYFIIAVILFTLTNNYGQLHYTIFLFIPIIYLCQCISPDYRKEKPIGPNISDYLIFEKYLRKYHHLPQ